MKKKIMVISIIVICILIYIVYDMISFGRIYATPEEALSKYEYGGLQVGKVVGVIEYGDYAIGLFKHGSTTESRYLHKTQNGWKMLYSKMCFSQYTKHVNGYLVCRYKHDGKNLLYINLISMSSESVVTPVDSIDSNFEYFLEEHDSVSLSHWFLVLNELPENYEIMLNGETIKLK